MPIDQVEGSAARDEFYNGAGYTHRWSADVDSLIGAQLTATFSPQICAVVQLVSEQS